MTRFLTISEARKQLLELPDTLHEQPVIITRHGKPVMAALSYEQFESLAETLDLLEDGQLMADLRESMGQAERGERVSLADVRARLSR
ncbi:type II toxin-antitoxin system Phd/YefM family antitoxin [Deinococcus saxicola]|uniref:type II toxin-antitoxin system Phd/YefM family antitoxin n=1 Tax=Deinococcus saxicola TaxID=249406 RepID=UPI0039F05207